MDRSFHSPHFRSALALVVAVALLFGLLSVWQAVDEWTDFLAFYNAGQMIAEGQGSRLYDQATLNERDAPHFLYPPLYAALFTPLAMHSFVAGRIEWGIFSLAALVLAAWISRGWSTLSLADSVLLLALFFPTYIGLIIGQSSAFSLLLLSSVALWLWQGKGKVLAGFTAGLTLFKPQLVVPVLLLWLWQRRMRELGGVLLALLFVAGGSLLLTVSGTLAFPNAREDIGGVVLATVEARIINPTFFTVAGPLIAGVVIAIVLVTLIITWRHPPTLYHHAMLWLAPLLVTPYLGTHDLLLVVLPLSFLPPMLRGDRQLQLTVALLLLLLTFLMMPVARLLVPCGLLLLYGTLTWRVLEVRLEQPASLQGS